MASSPIISWQIDGETMETVTYFIFLGSKITVMVTADMKLKDACFLEAKLSPTRQHIKKQRHCFADKDLYSQSYGFPVVMSDVRIGLSRKLSAKELMFFNCGVGEDS